MNKVKRPMSYGIARKLDEYVFVPMLSLMRPRRHSLYDNMVSLLIGISVGLIVSTPLIIRACDDKTETVIRQPVVYAIEDTSVEISDITKDEVPETKDTLLDEEPVPEPEARPEEHPATEPIVLSESDMDNLAKCVEAEASGEGLYGKRLVVDVILNRVQSSLFPGTTVTEIIFQHSDVNDVWQFSVAGNGMLEAAVPTQETYDAIARELECRSHPGLLYFTSEGFSPYGTPWQKVGHHYFSTAK